MELFDQIIEAVTAGRKAELLSLTQEALKQGADPLAIINEAYRTGMHKVGEKFECLEFFLPDMMRAADALTAGTDLLKPIIEATKGPQAPRGKIVLGTIQGDVHDIGKNIVKLMLETAGFQVVDLGRGVKVRAFIEKAEEVGAHAIGCSALMTSTMVYMPVLLDELKELKLRDKYKVIVGGAPVLPDWAEEIGADGYADDAMEAVQVVERLIVK